MKTPFKVVLLCTLCGCATQKAPPPAAPAAPATTAAPAAAGQRDWRWVQGAVFVPTNAVNEAQEWDEYDPATNDRELRNA
ncbi:MAG TPA: hypothetical protein VII09_03815, partial [Opitutaceae bacterium]